MTVEMASSYLISLKEVCKSGPTSEEVYKEFEEYVRDGRIRIHFVDVVPVWRIAKWNDVAEIFFPSNYTQEQIKSDAPSVLLDALSLIRGTRPYDFKLMEKQKEAIKKELSV